MGTVVESYPDSQSSEGVDNAGNPPGSNGATWVDPNNILAGAGQAIADLLPGTSNNDKSSEVLWGLWSVTSIDNVEMFVVEVDIEAEDANMNDLYAAFKIQHDGGETVIENLEKFADWPTTAASVSYSGIPVSPLNGVTQVEFGLASDSYGGISAQPRVETRIGSYELTVTYGEEEEEEETFTPYMIVI